MCIDAYVTICRFDSLITRLLLKKMSVMYESAHVAIIFQLLEMSSITIPNQTILNIHTRYVFQRFLRENIGDFTDLHNEKNNLEVSCKWNCFCYWNLCERLPNFVNVAALLGSHNQLPQTQS